MRGTIFDIKEMAVHDGPGVRTTVFFKGCPLRCRWCHNPEGLCRAPQLIYKSANCTHCGLCKRPCDHVECQPFGRCLHICPDGLLAVVGEQVEAKKLAADLTASASPLGDAFGGFTFSGGEPLMQSAFLLALAEELKGHHLTVETCGYAEEHDFLSVLQRIDLMILDIKLADDKSHRYYTGVGNEKIWKNLAHLKKSGKPYLIRTPLIPGITDTDENLTAIEALIGNAPWEQLPYNTLAGAKYPMLGMTYCLSRNDTTARLE